MTEEQAVEMLQNLGDSEDAEQGHLDGDAVLLMFLRANGFNKVVDAYESARAKGHWWYA